MLKGFCTIAVIMIGLAADIYAAQATRTLRWTDNSDDEDGCIIEAQRGNSGWLEVGRVGANQNSFVLTVQRNECYRVRCFNRWGVSAPSNQVCGRNYV